MLVPSLTSWPWDVGQHRQNWTEEPPYEWSLEQHLARGWSSVNGPAGGGTDASSRCHSSCFKGQAEAT